MASSGLRHPLSPALLLLALCAVVRVAAAADPPPGSAPPEEMVLVYGENAVSSCIADVHCGAPAQNSARAAARATLAAPPDEPPDAPRAAQEEWRGKVVRLSWRPRAYLWKNLLTEEECDHLTTLVRAPLGV